MTDQGSDQVFENPVEVMREKPGEYHTGFTRREFEGWIEEQKSWKETCYIGDWSFLSHLRISGPDTLDLLSDICVNSFDDYDIGQAKHIIQCNKDGKVIAEGVASRVDEETVDVHGVPGYWTLYNLQKGDYEATHEFKDTFNFQVQGPNSLKVLEKVSNDTLRDIEFIHFGNVSISGNDVTAVRMGMAGEVGFELQGPAEVADEVWDTIVEAGQEYGIRRLGGRTASINHLEACFPTRGREYIPAIFEEEMVPYTRWLSDKMGTGMRQLLTYPIEGSYESDDISDWYRSPVELGWKQNIKFDHEFIGKEALEEEVADPQRSMVTLVWDSDDVVDVYASLFLDGEPYKFMDMPTRQKHLMTSDKVIIDGETVGVSTGRGYSYHFREMLSLCTINVEYNEPGTDVTIIWGDPDQPQKEIGATVAPAPYKEDRRQTELNQL